MDVVHERCCGLDVHKQTVVACLLTPGVPGAVGGPEGKGRPSKEVRTFGTMTADLLALADWLVAADCTHVVMESTGVYWKPVWNVLEGSCALLLVNAQHVKQVPGRKTDVKDAEWLADLLRHGLLRGSFVPDQPQRELRELTRYRTAKGRERTREVQRLQKTLEGANIKRSSVATDVTGTSARAMLAALVAAEDGEDGAPAPATLAELAEGRLREKRPQRERALTGYFAEHHRFLVAEHLAQLDFLDATIERLSGEVAARLRPLDAVLDPRDAIPGIGRWTAEVLLAERGTDMSRFPTAGHLASWAGRCPGNHQSAGKRYSGRTRKGNGALRATLVEAAPAARRRKDTSLAAPFRRVAARRGAKKAAVAVGHSLLVIVYHLLRDGTVYQDLGPAYFDQRDQAALERRLVKRLEALGHTVTLAPAA
jgi:transposase